MYIISVTVYVYIVCTMCVFTVCMCTLCMCTLCAVFQITLVSAIAFPHWPPRGINVYFAFCMVLILVSHLILVSLTSLMQQLTFYHFNLF